MDEPTSAELDRLRERWVALRRDVDGFYRWDRWETQALSLGVDPELASLGRKVLLRGVDWPSAEGPDGAGMLELALTDPRAAARRWTELLSRRS